MAHVEVGAEIMTPPARPEVEVLLATYYGERFLREQIDSILAQDYAQDYPALRILARDDGSSDGTSTILAEYASQFPGRIRVMPDAHGTGGAKSNFLELMKAAGPGFVCGFGKMVTFSFFVSQIRDVAVLIDQLYASETLISPTKEFSPK